jgi:O-succinylbenzoic acid--CoA ligase
LVAIDLPGGDDYVRAVRTVWDRGDAVLPLDRRLPTNARHRLLEDMAPTRLLDERGESDLDGRPAVPGDAVVLATSGSTGTPKGVVLTHDAVRAAALATSERLAITDDDHWLACLPLAHAGGFGVLSRALLTGTRLTVHDGFDSSRVAASVSGGVTAVSLVATALARVDPALFRVVVVGGSRPPSPRPANVVATYGLTETGGGVVYDGVALTGVEVRIDNDEIWLRCPMSGRRYRNGDALIDAEGWLHTGDLGEIIDGRLRVLGRRGDLIITGGENVWPEQVERVLRTHPAVADAAVTSLPDGEWGERVVAVIVPRQPGDAPSLADLRAHVAETLPRFMAPKELRLQTTIPRTALGKVARAQLRAGING